MERDFHIGTILSITHDRLVSPEGIGGIYEILNFMTDDNLYTHVLPRAGHVCKPALLEQHPQLAAADSSNVDTENWREWLADRVEEFGETLPVQPLPASAWEKDDPIEELMDMVGPEKIIVVKAAE